MMNQISSSGDYTEMLSYLNEMKLLQQNMVTLEQNINKKNIENKKKIENIDVNVEFMRYWLEQSKKNDNMIKQLRIYSNQKEKLGSKAKNNEELNKLEYFFTQRHGKAPCPENYNINICYFGGLQKQLDSYKSISSTKQSEQDFMMSFVESTYNMFNIINTRLDGIDKRINIIENQFCISRTKTHEL